VRSPLQGTLPPHCASNLLTPTRAPSQAAEPTCALFSTLRAWARYPQPRGQSVFLSDAVKGCHLRASKRRPLAIGRSAALAAEHLTASLDALGRGSCWGTWKEKNNSQLQPAQPQPANAKCPRAPQNHKLNFKYKTSKNRWPFF
jgi:hypothetical protein